VPLNFEIKLNETKYAKEVTEFQRKYNAVVDSINGDTTIQNKLSLFVKKTCQKWKQLKNAFKLTRKSVYRKRNYPNSTVNATNTP